MKNVLLVHEGTIPHYRVPVYNYLAASLNGCGYELSVAAGGVESGSAGAMRFRYRAAALPAAGAICAKASHRPDAVILWVGPGFRMLRLLVLAKARGIKLIHWGHRRPLPPLASAKKFVYNLEHWIDDAIIVYSEEMRRYVYQGFQSKTFVANNTLNLTEYTPASGQREAVKSRFGVTTKKNIICMGRLQRRKRIEDLVRAFEMLALDDVGLILAGPDSDGLLRRIQARNIFTPGPLYGADALRLLAAADVFCLPGAIGLSIVDAMYCGLPVVTSSVVHGPEIMYLKDGRNGFIVPEGDVRQLAERLRQLMTDDELRARFSQEARREITTNGHIDRMCEGFKAALDHVFAVR